MAAAMLDIDRAAFDFVDDTERACSTSAV